MRIAIIGLGRISEKHIHSILNNKNFQLVGVCDIDKKKYLKNNIIQNIPFYENYLDLVRAVKPDLVSVLTDSGSHYKIGMELANLNVNTIIEKPLTLNIKQADELIKKFTLSNKKLFVVKQNRFNEPLQRLKKALNNKEIGNVFLCNITVHWCRSNEYYDLDEWRGKWASDGGVIANQAIHHLDAMIWLMGPVESVSSFNSTFGSNIEVDDTNISIVKFLSGALGTIETTTATRPFNKEGSITILGSGGSIKVGGHAMNKIEYWQTKTSDHVSSKIEDKNKDINDVYGNGHFKFYEHVYESILNNKDSEFSGESGRNSLELVASLYLSNKLGRIVKIGEDTSSIKLGNT